MNKLFSLLMLHYEVPESFSWFGKATSPVMFSDNSRALVGLITKGIPDSRRVLYVATLCNLVLNTQYGKEINQLDSNNTYVRVTRPKDATHSDPRYCMHDLIQPIQAYKDIKLYLQEDILARLDTNSWLDVMGAACLQLLRDSV